MVQPFAALASACAISATTPRGSESTALLPGCGAVRKPSRLDVAMHEAAHVVVALALGVRVRFATAQEQPDCWGYVWHANLRRRPLVDAIIAAAGIVYEARSGKRRLTGALDDYLQARRS